MDAGMWWHRSRQRDSEWDRGGGGGLRVWGAAEEWWVNAQRCGAQNPPSTHPRAPAWPRCPRGAAGGAVGRAAPWRGSVGAGGDGGGGGQLEPMGADPAVVLQPREPPLRMLCVHCRSRSTPSVCPHHPLRVPMGAHPPPRVSPLHSLRVPLRPSMPPPRPPPPLPLPTALQSVRSHTRPYLRVLTPPCAKHTCAPVQAHTHTHTQG